MSEKEDFLIFGDTKVPVRVVVKSKRNAKRAVRTLLDPKYDFDKVWDKYFEVDLRQSEEDIPPEISVLRDYYWDLLDYKQLELNPNVEDVIARNKALLNSRKLVRIMMALKKIKNSTGYIPENYNDVESLKEELINVTNVYRRRANEK